jgi:hypothetical protein
MAFLLPSIGTKSFAIMVRTITCSLRLHKANGRLYKCIGKALGKDVLPEFHCIVTKNHAGLWRNSRYLFAACARPKGSIYSVKALTQLISRSTQRDVFDRKRPMPPGVAGTWNTDRVEAWQDSLAQWGR